MWEADCNGLNTYNQVAVSNGDRTIVLADLAQFEGSQHLYPLWSAGAAFAKAYASALNSKLEEN